MYAVIASIWNGAETSPEEGGTLARLAPVHHEGAQPRSSRATGFRDALTIGTYPSGSVFIACVIAQHFSRGAPTVEALCERFDMSRSTAYRWRKAWLDALGMHRERSPLGEPKARRRAGDDSIAAPAHSGTPSAEAG